jgi:hypothetical protein
MIARPAITQATQARGYWLTFLLILLAISADLISGGVFSWLTPLIAPNLGVAVTDVTWASAIGSLALPLSLFLVADLAPRRRSYSLSLGPRPLPLWLCPRRHRAVVAGADRRALLRRPCRVYDAT